MAFGVSGLLKNRLKNHFAVAAGVAFASVALLGYPITTVVTASAASIALITFAFAVKNSLALTVSGYGGLLARRLLNSASRQRERSMAKTLVREFAGSVAGITAFLGGKFIAGPALAGSPELNLEKILNVTGWRSLSDLMQTDRLAKGIGYAFEEMNHQHKDMLIQAIGKFEEAIAAKQTLIQALQVPDVKALGITFLTAIALSVGTYMGVRSMIFSRKDFDANGERLEHTR